MRHRLSLTLALAFIALVSVAGIVAHAHLPARASAEALLIDRQFRITFVVLATLFLAAHAVLAVSLWRRRSGTTSSSNFTEALWAGLIVLIFAGLGISGSRVLAATRTYPAWDTIHLEATGMQFQWYFRYPGADGRFGETKPQLVDASVGNPLGIDPA